MIPDPKRPWFAPKRYGYGAGFPIAWQGWLALALYLAVLWGALRIAAGYAVPIIAIAATIALVAVAARKTKGGWRWRWGRSDG